MPLPGTDAAGKDVVLETVDLFLREFRKERGLQEAKEGETLPACVLSARFFREKLQQEGGQHHERVVIHGMLLIDEAGDAVSGKRAGKEVAVVFRRTREDEDVTVAKTLVSDERCDGA